MSGEPSTTNRAADTFDSIASEVSLNILLPLAERTIEAAAEAQFPFLLTPVVKQLFEGLTDHEMKVVARALLQAMVDNGVKIIITIQTDVEKSAYAKAEGDLRAALLTKDPSMISAARKPFEDAANAIIHSDGSLNVHRE